MILFGNNLKMFVGGAYYTLKKNSSLNLRKHVNGRILYKYHYCYTLLIYIGRGLYYTLYGWYYKIMDMSKKDDVVKYYFPSQIGYRNINHKIKIARMILEQYYPVDRK